MTITSLVGIQTAPVFRRQFTIFGNEANGGIPRHLNGSGFTIPPNPGEAKAYLSSVNTNLYYTSAIKHGNFIVLDIIWSVVVTNSTALQTYTTPNIGNRDMNGTQRGDGVYLLIYTGSNIVGATTTLSVNYTSSDGNIGRVGQTMAFNSPGGGRAFFVNLANGDTGVRSVQAAQFSALPGGGMNLLAVRPIAVIPAPAVVSNDASADAISLGLPEIYTGSNISIFYNLTGQVFGEMRFIYG
jgi:hypothetical protein